MDVLADPTATWVQERAERTRACLLATMLAVGLVMAAFGTALGIEALTLL